MGVDRTLSVTSRSMSAQVAAARSAAASPDMDAITAQLEALEAELRRARHAYESIQVGGSSSLAAAASSALHPNMCSNQTAPSRSSIQSRSQLRSISPPSAPSASLSRHGVSTLGHGVAQVQGLVLHEPPRGRAAGVPPSRCY